MNKSKLVQIISHLSSSQKEKFIKYLNSPYFLSSYEEAQQRLILFTKYLYEKTTSNNELTVSLQKMYVWTRLFGKKPYNDTRMRQEMTHLTKELEQFLTIESLQENQQKMDAALLEYYSKNQDLHSLFKSTLSKAQKQLGTKDIYKGNKHYYHLFNIQRIISYYNSWQSVRGNDANLQKTIHSLDLYYLISKLKYACFWANNSQKDKPSSSIDDALILQLSNNSPFSNFPIIKIYRYALLILKNELEDIQKIDEYIRLLEEHLTEFRSKDRKTLFTYAHNYLIIHINQTSDPTINNQLKKKLYQLYIEIGLKANILYVENKILPNDLKNIITLTLGLSEKDEWNRNRKIEVATELIQTHKYRILSTESEAFYQYNLAHLQFFERKYRQAIETINQIELSDINYILASRRLKIKAYHDLDTIDELEREVNSFRTAMYRGSIEGGQIPERVKGYNMHFIKMLKRIVHPKTYKNQTRIDKLTKEIQETRIVAERKWLLEKLEGQK